MHWPSAIMAVVTDRRLLSRLLPLAQASHPLPTVAVTIMTTLLIAGAGNSVSTCVVGAIAVLSGQLSIGWSNDAIDAHRDVAVRRPDKPVASGAVSPGVVMRAAGLAAVVTVPASLALGWRAGVVHLVGVACGWLYNLALKSTWLSAVPFAIAFGGLPAVATLALPD
ncbi:MAG: UbiA family prenyltransferase, partial [Nocardioidaceae bacterium]